MEDKKITPEQAERIRMGELAKNFLNSTEWNELVKPIIDSFVKGVDSVRGIKKTEANTDIKAQALILAHQMTANYLEEIEVYLRGFATDADTVIKVLDRKNKRKDFYKKVD
jgi:hypothetical protein